jgi:hypothetical protein
MASLDRLPRRFPVGTRYVVEGVPGDDGELTITSRMVVLPNGTELPVTPRRLAARLTRRRATVPVSGQRKAPSR